MTLLVGHLLDQGGGADGAGTARASRWRPRMSGGPRSTSGRISTPLSACRISPRRPEQPALAQEGFRQFRDSTISDYILARRLDRWRALILASDPRRGWATWR